MTEREQFYADAWTDDWSDLCDELGIDTTLELECGDFNSRQLRKRVHAWANERSGGWAEMDAAIGRLRAQRLAG